MIERKTTELPDSQCPVCDSKIDAATSVDGEAVPRPGDLTICFGCGALLILTAEMKHGLMTPLERKIFMDQSKERWSEILKLQAQIRTRKRRQTRETEGRP